MLVYHDLIAEGLPTPVNIQVQIKHLFIYLF